MPFTRDAVAALRIVRAVLHALRGLWIIRTRFARWTPAEREACIEAWAAHMLRILNVELSVQGERPAAGPLMVVANHSSWLDILAMLAARASRFVAKSEIRRWPLVGTVAAGAGTLFIERASRRDAMRVVHGTAEALAAGGIVVVFPEGTTSDGSQVLPFHANMLQAAIAAQAPVLPAAVVYRDAASGQPSRAAAYTGDDTLMGSLWRMLRADPLCAVVRFGAAQPAAGRERRAWAVALHGAVDQLRQKAGAATQ